MATYNNKHWLLSHIKNSFISTDDTGTCEVVMLSEDLPENYLALMASKRSIPESDSPTARDALKEDFLCYPGVDESEDDDPGMVAQSYEITYHSDGFQRQRSNTAQKLEKLDLARRRAALIKNVNYEDPVLQTESDFFERRSVAAKQRPISSLLTRQLAAAPKLPQNKFLQYAKFDGTAQTGVQTRTFRVFLSMLPERQRNYPITISVISSAKVLELIGLVCYKCSIQYPDTQLASVRRYGLFMTEEDGEVYTDFPALDVNEPCSKFMLSHLALVERSHGDTSPARSASMDVERWPVDQPRLSFSQRLTPGDVDRKMQEQDKFSEAPLYRNFRILMLGLAKIKTEVQLGVSAEKLEIDPVAKKNQRLWPAKLKAVTYMMEAVVWCGPIDSKPNKSIFRVVYCSDKTSESEGCVPSSSPTFKHHDFEAEPATAKEIIEKVNNIFALTTSFHRREYQAFRERRPKELNMSKRKSGTSRALNF